jgi:hypothetical protein
MTDPSLPADAPPERDPKTERPLHRQMAGALMIVVSLGLGLGALLKSNAMRGANDTSRWCTVWSLLERGTYAIDECPWQLQTQDKVRMKEPFPPAGEEPRKRFYSSKPPLMPTIVAGLLWPFRTATGVPIDATVELPRSRRLEVQSLDYEPKQDQRVVEVREGYKIIEITPTEPAKWSAHILYFDPVLVLLNIVPMTVFLVLFARWLDHAAVNDWTWLFSMMTACFGTNLFLFTPTLNNHTPGAYSAFFAAYAWLRIWTEGKRHWGYFAACGFFGAFAATCELPAAGLCALLFGSLLVKEPRRTLTALVPAALVPALAFEITLYAATGGWTEVVYSRFDEEGPDAPYRYPGSYWISPLEIDALDEPKWTYAFHLLLGHHGVFSLTPVFLYSVWGMFSLLSKRGAALKLRGAAAATLVLSMAVIAFYVRKTNNYGGWTQGARWLFWLFPLWLIFLPHGCVGGQRSRWLRRLALAALFVSALTSGYGLLQPWSHPWFLDALDHLGLYEMTR